MCCIYSYTNSSIYIFVHMCVKVIRNCCWLVTEEQHGTKLNGMHTIIVVISHRFAEPQGQNVIPTILRIRVQKEKYWLGTKMCVLKWLGYLRQYSDSLWTGQSGDQILVGARYSVPVQTGSEAHPSYIMGTGSFLGVKRRDVVLTTHPHLAPSLKKEQSYNSAPLWAFVAFSRVNFTFTFMYWRGRFELLSLIADMVYLTRYTF